MRRCPGPRGAAARAGRRRRGVAVLGLLAVAALAGACGGVRRGAATLGSDVIEVLREKEPEIFEIERRLADSAGAFVGRAVQDAVLTRATGAWDTMLIKVNEQAVVVMGRVAGGIERDLNRSLQVTIDENLRLADSAGQVAVGHLLDAAFADVRANADPLMDQVMVSLESGIRTRLRPVLIDVIGEASDSIARRIAALDSMLARSETGKGVSRLMWGLVIGLGVVVVGGGLAWRRSSRQSREALRAAVEESPAPLDQVRQKLRNRGFGRQADWLQ